jgi:hypothetical protein
VAVSITKCPAGQLSLRSVQLLTPSDHEMAPGAGELPES